MKKAHTDCNMDLERREFLTTADSYLTRQQFESTPEPLLSGPLRPRHLPLPGVELTLYMLEATLTFASQAQGACIATFVLRVGQ